MTKRVSDEIESFKYAGQPVKFTIGTLALIAFCIFLIIISTFTQLPVVDVFSLSRGEEGSGFLLSDYLANSSYYKYIPQLPAIFFAIALLDRRYGLAATFLKTWLQAKNLRKAELRASTPLSSRPSRQRHMRTEDITY